MFMFGQCYAASVKCCKHSEIPLDLDPISGSVSRNLAIVL